MFPVTSLSARKEKEGVQPCCSQFSKGSSYKQSSSKRSQVSPSTYTGFSNAHQFRGMFNKKCIIASRPQAEGDVLPQLIKHNKCFTIAARQSAEGDRLQKNPNIEMCIPSLSAGGSARTSRRGQRGDGNDVIKTRRRWGSIQGTSLGSHTQLARMRSSSVGCKHDFTGIQASICHETTQIQWYNSLSGRGRVSSRPDGRDRLSFRKTSHQSSAKGSELSGLLFPLLCDPKEGEHISASNSRSPCVKQAPTEIFIQNVDTQDTLSIHPPERLVCDDRSVRRVFSHRYLPVSQEVSQVCFSRHCLRISDNALWSVSSTKSIQQMCGSSTFPIEKQGDKNTVVHRRLSDLRLVERASNQRRRYGVIASQQLGIQNKHGKEPLRASSARRISGAQYKLPLLSSHSDREEDRVIHSMSLPFSDGESCPVQTVPANAGLNGFSDICSTTGTTNNERLSALGRASASVFSASSQPTGESDVCVRQSAQTLEKPRDPQIGDSPGGSVVESHYDDGRIIKGLGSDSNGQNCERRLAPSANSQTHKLLGIVGSVSSAETFSELHQGSACFSENRQFHSGCLYQPTGRHTLSSAAPAGKRADCVVRHKSFIHQGNPCSRDIEQGGRLVVQRKSPVRRVEASSPGGEADMAEIRPGGRRSLRLAGKRPMSSVLLSGRRKCTIGCGCFSPPMAKCPAVCISPSEPDFTHSSQGEGNGIVADTDSPTLAFQTLGGRDCSTTVGSAVAPPSPEGPPVTSGGGNLPSSPRQDSSLGLARERWNLSAAGLPPSVIHTIQSARASSTRSLYSNKWRVFDEWCGRIHIVPFQCSVRDILCFLQDLLDKGKAFSTIKVYLAAISACHVGFGDKTAGQHPLISRFMKGARRKRPGARRMVPLWDLSTVLEALSQHPFEPLEAIGLKFLSLKTALLLALVSAKRVSDLQALSVSPSCLQFSAGFTRVSFRPNPAFVPKVVDSSYRCQTTDLAAFHPPPFSSPEEGRLNALCPVRALRVYVERTAGFRKNDQLFVSWATPHKGKPLSRQRLSHWIVEAISLAYACRGSQPPEGLRAHSTRGMATSWALLRGVSVQEICAAASWATPHTFVRFYRLNVSEPSLAHAVLGVSTSSPI
ncbi:uncharacterized protein LOC128011656 [Carassius gibelio]|uniref:uncharacterized protein LOC128011656 n=1 Tax=Carassius gibelio TaxID=101364 RepID=UPI002279501A|nr:uncharacterized protein LOC128011656 [Carassius gibelio]